MPSNAGTPGSSTRSGWNIRPDTGPIPGLQWRFRPTRVLSVALAVAAVMISAGLAIQLAGTKDRASAGIGLAADRGEMAVAGVEVGVRFSVTAVGTVQGITFSKIDNAEQRPVALWRSDGTLLARARTVNETAAGAQVARFSKPVAVRPGVGYVAGYWLRSDRPPAAVAAAPSGSAGVQLGEFLVGPGRGLPRTVAGADPGLRVLLGPPQGRSTPSPVLTAPVRPQVATRTAAGRPVPTAGSVPDGGAGYPQGSDPGRAPVPTSARPSRPDPTPRPSGGASTPGGGAKPKAKGSAPAGGPAGAVKRDACVDRPSSCGFPDASSAGVPAGTALRRVPEQVPSGTGWHLDPHGTVVVDGDGAVLENLELTAPIEVSARNVTIRNVRVTARGDTHGIGLLHATNTSIANVQITAPDAGAGRLAVGIQDVFADSVNTDIQRVDISRTAIGVQIDGGTLQESYIHDLAARPGDKTSGITSNSSDGVMLTIRHNTVFNQFPQTDAIGLFEDFGPQYRRMIDNNLIAGGAHTLVAGASHAGMGTSDITITNNRFGRQFFATGGHDGPVTAFSAGGSGNSFTGNVWEDTGAAVKA